jgi:hypothetical protein
MQLLWSLSWYLCTYILWKYQLPRLLSPGILDFIDPLHALSPDLSLVRRS